MRVCVPDAPPTFATLTAAGSGVARADPVA